MKKRTRARIIAAAAVAALAGCGGGAAVLIAEDISDDMFDGLSCALNNCKASSTVSTDNVSPRFTVTQQNGKVHVEAWLGQSANLLTTLLPDGGDRLTASDGDAPAVPLRDAAGDRMRWVVDFADAGMHPRITVNFVRNGVAYPNTVTMPGPLAIASPTGPALILRSAGRFDVRLAGEALSSATVAADLSCTRSDRSSFTSQKLRLDAQRDAGDEALFHLSTLALDATLNQASLSANKNDPLTKPVATCTLQMRWTVSVQGSVSAALNQHGYITAQRSAGMTASYDAGG